MRIPTALIAGASLLVIGALPAQVAAEAKIYSYQTSQNYCPAGLQPVSISGVICCGVPNQHQTYQQVLAHPVAKKKKRQYKRKVQYRASSQCEIGTKGCTYD